MIPKHWTRANWHHMGLLQLVLCRAWLQALGSGHSFSSNFLEGKGHGPEDGIFNLNHILAILQFPNIFTNLKWKLIRKLVVMQTPIYPFTWLIKWLDLDWPTVIPTPIQL